MSEEKKALTTVSQLQKQMMEAGIDYQDELDQNDANVTALPLVKVEHSKQGKHKLYFDHGDQYTEAGEDESVCEDIPGNEFSGVIALAFPVRALFKDDQQVPECSSIKGTPVVSYPLAQSCDICPEADFDKGNCKSKIKMLIIRDKDPRASIFLLPPTSIKHYNKHLKKLKRANLPLIAINSKFSLIDKQKSAFRWAEVDITMDGFANPGTMKVAKKLRDELQEQFSTVSKRDYTDAGDTEFNYGENEEK